MPVCQSCGVFDILTVERGAGAIIAGWKRIHARAGAQSVVGLSDKMERYFTGDIQAIDDIEVQPAGTHFQRSVWNELRNIPVGIVVPCHRVIGANGSLTGYGGGLDRKRWLLDHEQKNATHN